jgi:hypothetical protein
MGFFPPAVRKLLQSNTTPWGEVFPAKPNPHVPSVDGRTVALTILAQYIAGLSFYLPQAPGNPPLAFQIPLANIYIEWPDSTEQMAFPSLAVVSSRADYNVIGLVSYVEEDTRDVFAPGTVVQWQAEYTETINLEIWCAKKAERRSILSGLETAISPTEQMSGLRFKMPGYFNELVCFTLMAREVMDEPDSARNRRRAQIELEMRFNIVSLVNYLPMQPKVQVVTDVDQFNVDVDFTVPPLSQDPNARTIPFTPDTPPLPGSPPLPTPTG